MKIDSLVRSKRKTIAIIVQRDGTLVVRAPLKASARQIQTWVDQKVGWIVEKRAEALKLYPNRAIHLYHEGESFLFLGKAYPLKLVEKNVLPLELNGQFRLDRNRLPDAKQFFSTWYRQQAQQILAERVAVYAKRYGFAYSQVKITSAITRWGSCSSKGSLNFTWRLVMAPLSVIDYVIVHELVHTQIRNHSRDFWNAVSKVIPDYLAQVEWLKLNGINLTLD